MATESIHPDLRSHPMGVTLPRPLAPIPRASGSNRVMRPFMQRFMHRFMHRFTRCFMHCLGWAALLGRHGLALAQSSGFEKINATVNNVNAVLVSISVSVVTIAIMWAGFRMVFQGARLEDVANVLIGGTLIGGAAAFASFIVN